MPDVKLTHAGVPAPLTETLAIGPGPAVPSPTLVQADQSTILGDGSHERPLHASPGIPGSLVVRDEGSPLAGAPHTTLNFVGGGVTATNAGGGVATVTVSGSAALIFEDEGTPLSGAPHSAVNFSGGGVTASNDAGTAKVVVEGAVLAWGIQLLPIAAAPGATFLGSPGSFGSVTDSFALPLPFRGVIRNLYARHNAAGGPLGGLTTYTLFKNGLGTELHVTLLTNTVSQDSNLAVAIDVAPGDRFSMQISSSFTTLGTDVINAMVSVEFGAG